MSDGIFSGTVNVTGTSIGVIPIETVNIAPSIFSPFIVGDPAGVFSPSIIGDPASITIPPSPIIGGLPCSPFGLIPCVPNTPLPPPPPAPLSIGAPESDRCEAADCLKEAAFKRHDGYYCSEHTPVEEQTLEAHSRCVDSIAALRRMQKTLDEVTKQLRLIKESQVSNFMLGSSYGIVFKEKT